MKLSNSHKALLITFFLTGTLVLSVFNFTMLQHQTKITETFIDIIPETVLETEELEEITENSPRTNKGYNETKKYKHFAQAYKPIAPPKDYENELLRKRNESPSEIKKVSKNNADSKLKNEELTAYKSVNSILNKRSDNNATSAKSQASANKNSSITYSLKDRTDLNLPVPIYLCETSGKIVVNITVDANGDVTDTYINNSSTSKNECLQEQALKYAKEARFSSSSNTSQLGSITFYFEGK